MNKRYIDFVPSKVTKTSTKKVSVKGSVVVKKPIVQKTVPKATKVVKSRVAREELVSRDRLEVDTGTFTLKKEPKYGVVEDFRPKFVKTEVPKRPLSKSHFTTNRGELAEAKATKVVAKKIAKPVEKPVEKSERTERTADNKTKMKIPKSPFINQAKVAKRPLSKNVYERTVKPTEEKSSGPVTIISTPEKEAKVGRVVAIILAIILGAAAGTVAFLLLPK